MPQRRTRARRSSPRVSREVSTHARPPTRVVLAAGVGPEHAWLKDSGRATYVAVDDKQACSRAPPAAPIRASASPLGAYL
eukprot:5426984-Pleurochrysis_carterae.AAC.1